MISIIIPFYNSEKYICNCIEMLQKQTYKNFEAIFINDGSTDNYIQYFNKNEDKRLRLINQEKKGVSAARNNGIDVSKGEYITFLDIDDEYEENFLEEMHNCITTNECDIAICNYKEIYSSSTNEVLLKWKNEIIKADVIKKNFIPAMIGTADDRKSEEQVIRGLVWRNIIKSDFLKSTNIKFDENVPIAEDLLFLLELYSKTEKMYITEQVLYRYNRFNGTTLDKYHDNQLDKQKYLHKQIVSVLKKEKLYEENKIRYAKNKLKMYTSLLSNSVRSGKFSKSIKEIKEISNAYNNDQYIKYIFGIVGTLDRINIIMLKLRLNILIYTIYSIKEFIRRKRLK